MEDAGVARGHWGTMPAVFAVWREHSVVLKQMSEVEESARRCDRELRR